MPLFALLKEQEVMITHLRGAIFAEIQKPPGFTLLPINIEHLPDLNNIDTIICMP
jgi:hypothetical protein